MEVQTENTTAPTTSTAESLLGSSTPADVVNSTGGIGTSETVTEKVDPIVETKQKEEIKPSETVEKKTETTEQKPAEQEKPIELKLPENSLIAESRLQEIAKISKEKGLTQEQAQEMLNSESSNLSKFMQSQQESLNERMSSWVDEIKADKEIG